MNEEMQKELLKRLDLLAEKLGTSAEFLWGIYVKQASVEVIQGLLIASVPLLASLVCVFLIRPSLRAWKKDPDDASAPVLSIIGAVGFLAVAFIILTERVITPFLNPEYWAFQQILSQLK